MNAIPRTFPETDMAQEYARSLERARRLRRGPMHGQMELVLEQSSPSARTLWLAAALAGISTAIIYFSKIRKRRETWQ